MSNSKIALLVRTCLPLPDDPTQTSYLLAQAVKERFEENNWHVIDIAADNAIRANVEKHLQNSESVVFLFYGHGEEYRMIGQDEKALIDLDNCHILKSQKVHVVACLTSEELGREVEDTVRYYLGYERRISVGSEAYSLYSEKCLNSGIMAMLDSPDCSIEQARQHTVDEYEHWIEYFSRIEASMNDMFFAADLNRNLSALAQVFGDKTATLID